MLQKPRCVLCYVKLIAANLCITPLLMVLFKSVFTVNEAYADCNRRALELLKLEW
jgi:hypothetical protein